MKNKLIFAYILFLIVEYVLRTFVKQYKFNEAGFLLELLPLLLATLITSIFSWKIIACQNFRSVYLKLSVASIFGFLTAKAILYIQWYWIIFPEHRNVNGDMEEGLAWTSIFSIISSLQILILYLVSVLLLRRIQVNQS